VAINSTTCKHNLLKMKRVILLITMIFAAGGLKAQTEFQELTLGAGMGAASTHAGSSIPTTTRAFNFNVAYYPKQYFDIAFEGQFGQLGGGQNAEMQPGQSRPNFANSYQAFLIEPVLHMGALFSDSYNNSQSDFINKSKEDVINFFKNFYVGAGLGIIHNNMGNIYQTGYNSGNLMPVIPIKVGYEFNIPDHFENTLMKLNLSYTFNNSIGPGAGANLTSGPRSSGSYAFYSLQLELPINVAPNHLRRNY
jgi:hypothetical protein